MGSTNKCPHNATNATSSMMPMMDSSSLPDYEVFQAEVSKHSLIQPSKGDEEEEENSHYTDDASMNNYVCNGYYISFGYY